MYKQDYEKSRAKELEFETYIKTKFNLLTETTDPKVYFPYWDISTTASTKHNNKVTTFEIKVCATDHVYIELHQIINQKICNAGLSITTSDNYVFSFTDEQGFYIIPTPTLKQLVYENYPINVAGKEYPKYHNCIHTVDANGYILARFDKTFFKGQCKKIL